MKHNIELLKADIEEDLLKIEKLNDEFSEHTDILRRETKDVASYDKGAIGFYIHTFYNGIENIFLNIARFFENDISPESWHSDLLKRMKLDIKGYRPAVIDDALYHDLNEFRAFRHLFRHIYGFDLDWERLRSLAVKMPSVINETVSQIRDFKDKVSRNLSD